MKLPVRIKLSYEEEFCNITVYKGNKAFFIKKFEQEFDACEYAGWLEAFYKACNINVTEVVL